MANKTARERYGYVFSIEGSGITLDHIVVADNLAQAAVKAQRYISGLNKARGRGRYAKYSLTAAKLVGKEIK